MPSDLIPMLTYHDETVDNAMELFESCRDVPVQYWGCKDVGLEPPRMDALVKRMKDAGKTTCLEGVRYSEEECMETARLALECGFDYLLGTIYFPSVHEFLRGEPIQYFPFCGRVHDHPSVLEGPIEEIVNQGRELTEAGVDGFDLLAYRYTGEAVRLARRFIRDVERPVIMAGSIGSFERLDEVRDLNPFAFTIGSAFFERNFVSGGSFADQIEAVVSYMKYPGDRT